MSSRITTIELLRQDTSMDEETRKLMLEGILATLAGVGRQLAVIDPYAPDAEEKPSRGGAAHYLVGGSGSCVNSLPNAKYLYVQDP